MILSADRTPPAHTRFLWTFGGKIPCPSAQISAEEFIQGCQFLTWQWRLLPITLPRFLRYHPQFQQTEEARKLGDLSLALQEWAKLQVKFAQPLVAALEKQGVPYALLKGSAVRAVAYRGHECRASMDVDIAVPRSHVHVAESLATEQGFLPAAFDAARAHYRVASDVERAIVEARHYELAQLVRRQLATDVHEEARAAILRSFPLMRWVPPSWHLTDAGELACYLTVDIHHGISPEIPVVDLVASSSTTICEGARASIPSIAWLVFHLIYKIYWEGVYSYRKGGYQYADLIRLAERIEGEAARQLVALLREYNLVAAGYYVLRRLISDFACDLSPEITAFLADAAAAPQVAPLEANDLGDMWPKLWGFR